MSLLRLLNVQGIAGIAVSLTLAVLLVIQKGETRHRKKESGRFEQLYQQQQSALATTVSNYRAAAEQAEAADRDNALRVEADQRAINERTEDDYQARVAAARSLAQRLRGQSASAAADSRGAGAAPVPGLSAAASGPAQAAVQDRLPVPDRELATDQAIQLDELIKWVLRQHSVDPNEAAGARQPPTQTIKENDFTQRREGAKFFIRHPRESGGPASFSTDRKAGFPLSRE